MMTESQTTPDSNDLERLRALVAENRMLEAIDLYREHNGVGPAEAKAYVEAEKWADFEVAPYRLRPSWQVPGQL